MAEPENNTPPADPNPPAPEAPPAASGFKDGYSAGKTAATADLLKTLGVASLDDAKAAMAPKPAEPTAPKSIAESEEYIALAGENLDLKSRLELAESQLTSAAKLADQARVEKIKGIARSVGVGEPQLGQFAKLFGDQIQLASDGESLVVMTTMSDGNKVPGIESAEKYLEKAANENAWFLAPKQPAGSGNPNESPGGATPRPIDNFFDRRSFNERATKNQGSK